MTPEELKKIDELMAVEVMGAVARKEDGSTILKIGHVEYMLNDWDGVTWNVFHKTYPLFTPTTDMNQAMECVIKSEVFLAIDSADNTVYLEGEYFGTYNTVEELACLLCKAILTAKNIQWNVKQDLEGRNE